MEILSAFPVAYWPVPAVILLAVWFEMRSVTR